MSLKRLKELFEAVQVERGTLERQTMTEEFNAIVAKLEAPAKKAEK